MNFDDYGDSGGDWGFNYGDSVPETENWGLNYGEADPYYDPEASGDWGFNFSQEGDQTFDPDAYLSSQGGYTPPSEPGLWEQLQGMPAQMGGAFMQKLRNKPMDVLGTLVGGAGSIYSAVQKSKQREAAARELRDVKAAREARMARYSAPINYQATRGIIPQGDFLHAGERVGGLSWFTPTQFTPRMAEGGALSRLLHGPGDGTSDDIPINAADGEYIFDAESVSALGNGSNEAGARKLDELRERLRAHKRSAPNHKIAPDAKEPEQYMRGKK